MITLTLNQAKRLLRYSAILYTGPVVFVALLPYMWTLGVALVLLFLLWEWRSEFERKVITAEIMSELDHEDGETGLVSSNLSDLQVGFHGSAED